jgi:SPP1 family predicted phage head-tail adaptor
MPLNVGRFNVYLTIVNPAQSLNAAGQPTLVESTVAQNVPAVRLPVRVNERFQASRDMAAKLYKYRLRYRTDLQATYKVIEGGSKFDIRGIMPGGVRGREYIEILCEAFETLGV